MGIVVSFILIIVGAIMRFAVTAEADGFDVNMVGVILLLVGLVGVVFSIVFWASWGGLAGLNTRRQPQQVVAVQRTVVQEPQPQVVAVERTVVQERQVP